MDNRLERIEEMLDKQNEILLDVSKTLERNTISLEVHEKRTSLLEENVQMLRDEMKPLQSHVAFINAMAKIMSVVMAIVLGAKQLGLF